MLDYREEFNFYHWLAVSLVLHLSIIALPCILTNVRIPHQHKHNKLAIELFGMIADRQQEERKGGTGIVPRRAIQQIAIRRPAKKTATRKSPDTYNTNSPTHLEKGDDKPDPTDETTGPTSASAVYVPAVSGTGGQGEHQRQQSIGYGNQGADKIREYLARLSKRLQANLVYPKEVRKDGVEGVSWIAFTITESGTIKGNSLRVQRSSGYAALDSNALKSARVSTPFEKPPKELNVTLAVAFSVETARPRTNHASEL